MYITIEVNINWRNVQTKYCYVRYSFCMHAGAYSNMTCIFNTCMLIHLDHRVLERIVLGGGVLNRHCLYAMIRQQVRRILNGYVRVPQLIETEDKVESSSAAAFIGPSFWGPDAGIIGAAYLAVLARTEGSDRT